MNIAFAKSGVQRLCNVFATFLKPVSVTSVQPRCCNVSVTVAATFLKPVSVTSMQPRCCNVYATVAVTFTQPLLQRYCNRTTFTRCGNAFLQRQHNVSVTKFATPPKRFTNVTGCRGCQDKVMKRE